MSKIVNARIEDVSIQMGVHACLTFWITLKSEFWTARFGGVCIGYGFLGGGVFEAENGSGLVAMMQIMDTVGVERWEDLKGKYVRVVDEGLGSTIKQIGNIIENKWFNIVEFFEEYNEDSKT